MSKSKIFNALIIAVISIFFLFTLSFLVACRETIITEETEPGEEVLDEEAVEEPEQIVTNEPVTSCYNSYFPIKENIIWNYRLQAPEIESFNYSLSFKDVTDNSFSQILIFEGGKIESKWNCSELGILQTEYRELSFTDSGAGQAEFETIGVEGITFPPEDELNIGKTWKVVYDTKAKINAGDTEIDAAVKVEMEYEIISIEDVEVPSGEYYDALNVLNKTTISISSDFFNTVISSDSNSWYVRDIGLVKNVGSLEDTPTITELLSIE